jgi:3-deoxy-D-manno-octulosonic acid kinase
MDWKNYAGQHTLADFAGIEHGGARILARQGYQDSARLLAERRIFAPVESVGGGREPHPVVILPTGEKAVVRTYRRGGLMRHVNRRLYFAGNRAFDELRATEHAREGGVRVPRVIAAIEVPAVIGYRALLVTLLVPGTRDAAAWLPDAGAEDRAAMLADAGAQIAAMHGAGVVHRDLNLRNLLVGEPAGEPRVHLLDFDRAVVHAGAVPAPARAAALRRLDRSARKLRLPLGPHGWTSLRAGYGEDWPPGLELG